MWELKAMNDMIDKKTTNRISESLSEQIVRDFRKNEGLELGKALNPLKPISTIRPYRGIRWWNKVNWIVAFNWTCLILAALAVLIISGLILFGSFSFH
jgi:hypothetical protein